MIKTKELQNQILNLKEKNDVTILAHYYQPIEIQEIADFLGDSLTLSYIAKEKVNHKFIIFAGVKFMAETASILNQNKKIYLPNPEACCPMAQFLTPNLIRNYKQNYPECPIITYINSTASVKAESDICCTSSNALKIVMNIAKDYNANTVLFGPDANLADYINQSTDLRIISIPEKGHCITHSQLSLKDINSKMKNYPKAAVLVHPECIREVRNVADFIGSTAAIYNFVKQNSSNYNEFIIGTEKGLLDRMEYDFPNKKFFLANDNLICYSMKKNNLQLIKYILNNLEDNTFEVKVPSEIARKAINPINKMLQYK